MRINVYSQELTKEVTLVSQVAKDTGITYYGVRFWLASPDLLHHTAEDDDRSAITFWIPQASSFRPSHLASVFIMASALIQCHYTNDNTVKDEIKDIIRKMDSMLIHMVADGN